MPNPPPQGSRCQRAPGRTWSALRLTSAWVVGAAGVGLEEPGDLVGVVERAGVLCQTHNGDDATGGGELGEAVQRLVEVGEVVDRRDGRDHVEGGRGQRDRHDISLDPGDVSVAAPRGVQRCGVEIEAGHVRHPVAQLRCEEAITGAHVESCLRSVGHDVEDPTVVVDVVVPADRSFLAHRSRVAGRGGSPQSATMHR